ncbi:unnamed protein product [Arabidopsis thaliana]|uniref:Uncharacterized protein n=1 Tax=Arabidopsis thaliana TaxID=3702 RepID=A0A5S9XHQ6_ARATH|nr:unnamed protein product [Arabidopsis thaliana]
MAREYLGPSVVLFPVIKSTAHDELLCWQVVSPGASPSIITSDFHDGGDLSSLLPTAATLGFALLRTLLDLSLKHCFTIMDGCRLNSIVGTLFLEEPCNYNSRHMPCDAAHASTLLCEHITSLNLPTITLTHLVPCLLLGDASQPSWICWIKPLRLARSTSFSSLLKQNNLGLLIRRLYALWTCHLPCRTHQAYSSKEIPSLKPYSSKEISSLKVEPGKKPQRKLICVDRTSLL